MTRLWRAWVAHTSAPLDTRVLAMVRIGVALCLAVIGFWLDAAAPRSDTLGKALHEWVTAKDRNR